ncbi:MAG: hypothetical protein IPL23_24300 [Saprospiraceae bacterium]|nr:hypothetical protein [Saprospiraceae bacterium]
MATVYLPNSKVCAEALWHLGYCPDKKKDFDSNPKASLLPDETYRLKDDSEFYE